MLSALRLLLMLLCMLLRLLRSTLLFRLSMLLLRLCMLLRSRCIVLSFLRTLRFRVLLRFRMLRLFCMLRFRTLRCIVLRFRTRGRLRLVLLCRYRRLLTRLIGLIRPRFITRMRHRPVRRLRLRSMLLTLSLSFLRPASLSRIRNAPALGTLRTVLIRRRCAQRLSRLPRLCRARPRRNRIRLVATDRRPLRPNRTSMRFINHPESLRRRGRDSCARRSANTRSHRPRRSGISGRHSSAHDRIACTRNLATRVGEMLR
jgi:hypothetical protein